jgi:acyl-CoA synthetase (AMP-forming)/AMP-acid ligase II
MTELVHTCLAHWAQQTPHQTAVVCDNSSLSFQQLHEAVTKQAALYNTSAATCLVVDAHNTLQQLIAFLGIVQSGRCAAVTDPDWPAYIRHTVANALPKAPLQTSATLESDPFYIGFTSGSTGTPKGFQRDHRSWVESFRVCAETFDMDQGLGVLAPGRISHSLFLFGMLLGLYTGAGIAIQNKFSASHTLATLQAGQHPCLVAVPSQLIMLLQWARHRHIASVPQVRLILISGARWMRQHTADLQSLFPNARIVEFYGASETSFIAWKDAQEPASADAVGRPFSNVELQIRSVDTHALSSTSSQVNKQKKHTQTTPSGVIYVRSPMLFMSYVGTQHDPTAAVRDGEWLSVGDMGYINAQGHLCLSGRQNRMIVTQGKNLFPEELENLLATHPSIANASVHALPDEVRGSQVVAVLQPSQKGAQATYLDAQATFSEAPASFPNAQALSKWCQQHLEAFKVPRQFWLCESWPLTPSGKTDHTHIAQALMQHHSQQNAPSSCDTPRTLTPTHTDLPCLQHLS